MLDPRDVATLELDIVILVYSEILEQGLECLEALVASISRELGAREPLPHAFIQDVFCLFSRRQ
tara:strand:- start:5284 stop:5475 length:192 start_codon:yes stop_codon:yes gene_type:complete